MARPRRRLPHGLPKLQALAIRAQSGVLREDSLSEEHYRRRQIAGPSQYFLGCRAAGPAPDPISLPAHAGNLDATRRRTFRAQDAQMHCR